MEESVQKGGAKLIYAVGDIHGCASLLDELLEKISEDFESYPDLSKELVFLGDYIDRGIGSRQVVETLLGGLPKGAGATFLRGNHEEMFLRFADGDLNSAIGWLQLGGGAMLASYGVNPFRPDVLNILPELREEMLGAIPAEHMNFFRSTVLSYSVGNYYFAHAGVRPERPLDKQEKEDLLWIRHDFTLSGKNHGKVVVHGHSVCSEPEELFNRIGIDTGAYATGRLTCVVLRGGDRRFIST